MANSLVVKLIERKAIGGNMYHNDLELAKASLEGKSIALARDGDIITSTLRGIGPMITFKREHKDLAGYSVADLVVGKAAAFLFIDAGIKEVYAKNISVQAKRVLKERGIYLEYEVLAEAIINREGTDLCPMEKLVKDIDDISSALPLIEKKYDELRSNSK